MKSISFLTALAIVAVFGLTSCKKECDQDHYMLLDECEPLANAFVGTWHITNASCNHGNQVVGQLVVSKGTGAREVVINNEITAIALSEWAFDLPTTTLTDQNGPYSIRATGARTFIQQPSGTIGGQFREELRFEFWRNEGTANEVHCTIYMDR